MRLFGAIVVSAALVIGTVSAPASAAHSAAARRPCSAGLIALTFDDGPSPTQTPRLVRILREHRVPATFFMVGSRVAAHPAVARLVADSGFGVANHTWSHPELPALNDGAVRSQLVRTERALRKAGVTHGRLMRPPYGAANPRVRRDISRLHLTSVLWTVDSEDWVGGNAGQIAGRILAQLRPHRRNVVLQHDGINNSPASVGAVPIVIRKARQRGYCFTDLDEAGRMRMPVPTLSATLGEGAEAGPTPVRVLLTLDRPTSAPVSVQVTTAEASATAEDFSPTALRVGFPSGVLSAWVTIPVLADDEDEDSESFAVRLDAPAGLVVAQPENRASIVADDVTEAPSSAESVAAAAPPPGTAQPVRRSVRIGTFDPWYDLR